MRLDNQVKGTRLLLPPESTLRRTIIATSYNICEGAGFREILLPCLEPSSVYENKAGSEILDQMYTFQDKKGRELCLRPEGTATIQLVSKHTNKKDVKYWYETRCWRYEQPQEGRYREFTQFGVEWLNPKDSNQAYKECITLARNILYHLGIDSKHYVLNQNVKRGFSYYKDGQGFEIIAPSLGAQNQIIGGGIYAEGVGFAIGVDRIMLLLDKLK